MTFAGFLCAEDGGLGWETVGGGGGVLVAEVVAVVVIVAVAVVEVGAALGGEQQ